MRLGIIREALYLPPPASQHQALTAHGCDVLKEERGSDFVADRRVQRLISDMRAGDELTVHSLGVLVRPQGRPARVVRDILEAGVILTLAPSRATPVTFRPDHDLISLACAIADHERGRNVSPAKSVHQGGSRNRLSKYQMEYARKLYAEGESLRSIGLLFQLSPNHVLEVVAPPHADRTGADARHH